MDNNLMVVVLMVTYNHEHFIRQAIESVVGQETDFRFQLIIGEDHSTDATRDICIELQEKYPDKIHLILNPVNIGVNKNASQMHRACYDTGAKYIAICEGDDYWSDTRKLQKQVDFLEANTDYTICWTRYKILRKDTLEHPEWESSMDIPAITEVTLDNLFLAYRTYAVTVLYSRTHFNIGLWEWLKHGKDNTIYAMCLSKGKGRVLDFYGSVYRIHEGGFWSAAKELAQNMADYLNVKEINDNIPGSSTEHLKSYRRKTLRKAFYLVCNEQNCLSKIIYIYREVLIDLPFRDKLIASKEVIKQLKLKVF